MFVGSFKHALFLKWFLKYKIAFRKYVWCRFFVFEIDFSQSIGNHLEIDFGINFLKKRFSYKTNKKTSPTQPICCISVAWLLSLVATHAPSAAPLWLAAKQNGLMFSKKVVEAFVKEKGERQVFQAVQPARGKTVSESIDARWQMDLISFVNQPVVVGGKTFKWILVCINTFDRYLYALPMQTKEQVEVRESLEKILNLE